MPEKKIKLTDSLKQKSLISGVSYDARSGMAFDHSAVVIQSFHTANLVCFSTHVTGDYVTVLAVVCLCWQTEIICVPVCKEEDIGS